MTQKVGILKGLEAESIEIIREVFASARNPVMLYSMGKDSSVLLHLARKAFWPGPIPFSLLHVDTTWKFKDMIRLREEVAKTNKLIVYINKEGLKEGIDPIVHGSEIFTHVMKTVALKKALDHGQYDFILGGARRDEEKSRAKERIFSFRSQGHQWDPKAQRPELWSIYNTRLKDGETMRVFPLSNWTEADIWNYIASENIPIVPLYFAAMRPVVQRRGQWIMVDDQRFVLQAGEKIEEKSVRFRTLGCYPLTAAVESHASNLQEVIAETLAAKSSERHGRLIDHDNDASMERKKQEGYF